MEPRIDVPFSTRYGMWEAIEILGGFVEMMPICLSKIMVMRFGNSGVAVLVDVARVVVLHAHSF